MRTARLQNLQRRMAAYDAKIRELEARIDHWTAAEYQRWKSLWCGHDEARQDLAEALAEED